MGVMVRLHTPIHVMLPIRVWIAIWRRRTGSYMKCIDSVGLLRPTCWIRRVYMHHVIRLHNRQCQHCCEAKDVMPWYCVAEADVLGLDVSICTMLLDCMTDDVSTIAEPETQCHDIGLLRPTCWVGRVYMHHVVRLHERRRQHYCEARDAIPWYWVAEADVLSRICLYAPFSNSDLLS